jgi:glycosyltransferase involved in cell wall biosynthesis
MPARHAEIPLNVLHVLEMNPNKRGPVELQLVELSKQVRATGGRQTCCFPVAPPDWYSRLLAEAGTGVEVVPNYREDGDQIVAVARRSRPDVVHLHFVHDGGLIRTLAREGALVFTEHSLRYPQGLEWARRVVRRARTRDVDAFVAVSRYIATQVRRDYLASSNRVWLVFNGVNLEYFRPRSDKMDLRRDLLEFGPETLVVAAAHYLHPLKRLDLLVRAFPAVVEQLPQARLVLAGDGPERARLAELIDTLGLGGNARILSDDPRVELIYAASDIAVSSSPGEGLPGSCLEALACGLPLVATPGGGQAEVAEHGVSGLVVRDETPEGLARAIVSVLGDEELRSRMGRSARARAEELFDVRRTAAETLAVYRDVLHTAN